MPTPSSSNIIKSGATIWYAAFDDTSVEALPDETSVEYNGAWGGNWAKIAYTAEPVKLLKTDERMQITTEEFLTELDEFRIAFMGEFTTILSEVTADIYAILFGGTVSTTAAGAGQKGYEEINIDPTALVAKYTFGLEGFRSVAGVQQPVRWWLPKATIVINGESEYSQKTDSYWQLPVKIKVLKDDVNDSPPFMWQRVTAAATS